MPGKKGKLAGIMKTAATLRKRGLTKSEAMKRAWAIQAPKRTSKSHSVTFSNPYRGKRGGGSMRKTRRGRRSSPTRSLFKAVRLAGLLGPAAVRIMESGSGHDKVIRIVADYTGYDIAQKRYDFGHLARGWFPFLGACLVTYGIPKLVGILRRL